MNLDNWWTENIEEYWTLPDAPRPSQKEMIYDILNGFMNEGYENIILEGGTGLGKSAIATTIAIAAAY